MRCCKNIEKVERERERERTCGNIDRILNNTVRIFLGDIFNIHTTFRTGNHQWTLKHVLTVKRERERAKIHKKQEMMWKEKRREK